MPNINSKQTAKLAFRFVIIIGVVNLFADMAYEGGRSISGPFLGSLGASATIVSLTMPESQRSFSQYRRSRRWDCWKKKRESKA